MSLFVLVFVFSIGYAEELLYPTPTPVADVGWPSDLSSEQEELLAKADGLLESATRLGDDGK